ncbi:MAG: flagellar FlbD family protein [Acidobacteriota bacterium]
MIEVTKMNHTRSILNSDLIEHLEATPDTVISLTNGHKMMVLESADEVVRRVIEFRQKIAGVPLRQTTATGSGSGRQF